MVYMSNFNSPFGYSVVQPTGVRADCIAGPNLKKDFVDVSIIIKISRAKSRVLTGTRSLVQAKNVLPIKKVSE